MTHEERLKLLTEWYGKGLALEEAADDFRRLLGIEDTTGCSILKAAWDVWDAYTAEVSARVGDTIGWLMLWWWCEARHGTGTCDAAAAAWKGKTRPIRTVKDLCRLIEADLPKGQKNA